MAKKVQGYLKLQIPAGAANPSPPVGPALGQRGVNIMEFCKQFGNSIVQSVEVLFLYPPLQSAQLPTLSLSTA